MPEDEARPYITSRHEAHPNPTGDGEDTVAFFRDNFGFRGGFKTILWVKAHPSDFTLHET